MLLVEDDVDLASALAAGFREEGFAVDVVGSGLRGLHEARGGEHDILVLDLMLPDLDGLSLLRRLRDEGSRIPILVLTARDSIEDRVRGLRLGGDDYVCKPFSFEELLARVRVLIRRANGFVRNRLAWSRLVLNLDAREASWDEASLHLTPKEFALLEALLLNKGRTLSRTKLIEHLYGYDSDCDSNVIDVHMANLRRKLKSAAGQSLIQTVRGFGFRLPDESP
jgi:DNA-binding response OmpR family regulator